MDKVFRVGDFVFLLSCEEKLEIPPHFQCFETRKAYPVFFYKIRFADFLPEPEGKLLVRKDDLVVLEQEGRQIRYLGIKGEGFYGMYREMSRGRAEIFLIRTAADLLQSDPVFVSLFALERHLLPEEGIVLHCAYIRYQGKAILFSAPSGTGKSTQAGLWEKYRGAEIINGDRALLEFRDGRWIARGWPVCGTSDICENRDAAVGAVVMLSQTAEDQVQHLSPVRAFREVFPQLTVNRFDRKAQLSGISLAEELAVQVPFWHLGCTISENAVRCLEKALTESGILSLSGNDPGR